MLVVSSLPVTVLTATFFLLILPFFFGVPWWSSNVACACRRVFNGACLSCRLHDLWHTHAAMLLRQGVHPKVVQERLGHANVGITLDVQSYVMPGMRSDAAVKTDARLRAALTGQNRRKVGAGSTPSLWHLGRWNQASSRCTTPPLQSF